MVLRDFWRQILRAETSFRSARVQIFKMLAHFCAFLNLLVILKGFSEWFGIFIFSVNLQVEFDQNMITEIDPEVTTEFDPEISTESGAKFASKIV